MLFCFLTSMWLIVSLFFTPKWNFDGLFGDLRILNMGCKKFLREFQKIQTSFYMVKIYYNGRYLVTLRSVKHQFIRRARNFNCTARVWT